MFILITVFVLSQVEYRYTRGTELVVFNTVMRQYKMRSFKILRRDENSPIVPK